MGILMKKLVLLIIAFFSYNSIYSQQARSDYNSRYYNIIKHLEAKEYYDAIPEMDYFLMLYPNDRGMYHDRGIAKLSLNDYIGAKADFIQAKNLGEKNDNLINFMTSKSLLVNLLTKDYIDSDSLSEANGFKPVFGLKDSLQGALRPERTCYDIYFYNLTVKILPEKKSIEGSNQIHFKANQNTNRIQVDLSDNFEINSIRWHGRELKYTRVYNAIFINFNENLPIGENQILTVTYSGVPRVAPSPPWNGGFVWEKTRGDWWIGVACEHLGASSWWPCKDHLSEKPDSMSINIQVPSGYQAIANGNLRSTKPAGNNYTNFEWFVSYPINSYGVTFYMGKFVDFNEVFTNINGSYNIDYYVLPNHLKKAKKYYNQTKDIVKVYEKLYGEYPFKKDGIAMVEAPFAGMEHQSAIAIGDEYGSRKRRDYENTDYDYLIVHETAHEWWGNTVTMGDMADAWISEGFATYSEHLFIEEKLGYPEYISASASTMKLIFNIWPMVGIRDVNDNTFIGGDIYNKGAAMLNNLRCIMNNDSTFFALIKSFYNQYKFKIVTSNDFVKFVNNYTGKDYTDFFNKFLYGTNPPVLQYSFKLNNDKLLFSFRWIDVGNNFTMPFSITINNKENLRLDGSAKYQTVEIANVKSFYLPSEQRFDKNQIIKNSFTYYWTSWKH